MRMWCLIRLVSEMRSAGYKSRSQDKELGFIWPQTNNSQLTPYPGLHHDTLKGLLRINDELFEVCKWLNENRGVEISSRLIPLGFSSSINRLVASDLK